MLDTNILVSAFLFEKRLGKIVKLIEQGKITPCFIFYTLDEFKRVLSYEKFETLFLNARFSISEIIESVQDKSESLGNPKIVPDIIPDNNPDNYILAAAALAESECIVTGDKLLLSLKEFKNIPIITPQDFLKKFK